MVTERRCDKCIFAAPAKDHNRIECRRRAPVVIGGMHSPEATVWPIVLPWFFCGDWADQNTAE